MQGLALIITGAIYIVNRKRRNNILTSFLKRWIQIDKWRKRRSKTKGRSRLLRGRERVSGARGRLVGNSNVGSHSNLLSIE